MPCSEFTTKLFVLSTKIFVHFWCYPRLRGLFAESCVETGWSPGWLLGLLGVVYAAHRNVPEPFRQYPGDEYENFPLPPDWQQRSEFAFARLMYPHVSGRFRGFGAYGNGDWRQGMSIWTQDYPRADRHFSQAVRRLTRVDVR